jgi:hypothetical protein
VIIAAASVTETKLIDAEPNCRDWPRAGTFSGQAVAALPRASPAQVWPKQIPRTARCRSLPKSVWLAGEGAPYCLHHLIHGW